MMINFKNLSQGYCYLRYVGLVASQLGWDIDMVCFDAKEELGYNPLLLDVLRFLVIRDRAAVYVRVPMFTCTSSGQLHVPYYYLKDITVGKIVMRYTQYLHHRLGASLPTSTQYEGVSVDKVLQMLGINTDNIIKESLMQMQSTPIISSIVQSAIVQKMEDTILKHTNDYKLILPMVLSVEDEKNLTLAFPHYHFKFSNRTTAQHAYAAASRMVELEDLLRECGYFNDEKLNRNFDARVVDIGGNWLTHLNRARRHVHCCCPILTPEDSKRASYRLQQLSHRNSLTFTQKEILQNNFNMDWEKMKCKAFCMNKGQDCKVRAPACIFLHSIYDMTNKEVADAMDSHGSVVGYGTFIFYPDMVFEMRSKRTGNIPILNVQWTLETIDGEEHIRFAFVKDASWNYVHKLKDYMQFALTKSITSSNGVVYYVEFKNNVNGIQYFSITKCSVPALAPSMGAHVLWNSKGDKVRFDFFELDPTYLNFGYRRIIKKVLFARTSLVVALMTYALGMNESKFSPPELYQYAKAWVSRLIINGTQITNRTEEYSEDVDFELYSIVQVIYILVYEQKYNVGIMVKEIMDEIKEGRENKSIFSKLLMAIPKKLGEMWNTGTGNMINTLLGSMLARRFRIKYGIVEQSQVLREWLPQGYGMAYGWDVPNSAPTENLDVTSIYIKEKDIATRLLAGGDNGDEEEVDVIYQMGKCMESQHELIRSIVPGDGSCQFHAIGAGLMHKNYRKYLVDKYKNDKNSPPQLKDMHSWGDDDTLNYICRNEKINICVHIHEGNEQFRHFVNKKATKTVHVRFESSHYDALIYTNTVGKAGPLNFYFDGGSPLSVPEGVDDLEDLISKVEAEVGQYEEHLCEMHKLISSLRRTLTDSFETSSGILKKFRNSDIVEFARRLFTNRVTVSDGLLTVKLPPCPRLDPRAIASIESDFTKNVEVHGIKRKIGLNHKANINYLLKVKETTETIVNTARKPGTVFKEAVEVVVDKQLKASSGYPTPPDTPKKNKNKDKAVEQKQEHDEIDDKVEKSKEDDNKASVKFDNCQGKTSTEDLDDILPSISQLPSIASETSSIASGDTISSCISVKDSIYDIREKISKLDDAVYARMVTAMKKSLPNDCLNRSQAKLREIFEMYPQMKGNSLDLCSAPGGFVLEMINKGIEVTYVPYIGDIIMDEKVLASPAKMVMITDNNDILDPEFKSKFKLKEKFDIVTADGALNLETMNMERDNYDLIAAECDIALMALREGGHFILKVFDLMRSETRNLMADVAVSFSEFKVHRLKWTTMTSGEYYVVFLGKLNHRDCRKLAMYKGQLKSVVKEYSRDLMRNLTSLFGEMKNTVDSQKEVNVNNSEYVRRVDAGFRSNLENYWTGNSAIYRQLWIKTDVVYRKGETRNDYAYNAVQERRELWRIAQVDAHKIYDDFYATFLRIMVDTNKVKKLAAAHSENFGVIDSKTGLYVVVPKDLGGKYEFAYNGERFIPLLYVGDDYKNFIPNKNYKYLLVGNMSRLMQDSKLYNATTKYHQKALKIPPMKLISGVPGCGKTFFILNNVKEEDFVLTTTKENCEDVKARLKENTLEQNRVRTMHSLIIHGFSKRVETLYIDEALMAHVGEILLAANEMNVKNIVLIGDENQIPFINRSKLVRSMFHCPKKLCDTVEYMNVSHRVPRDVAKYFSTFYQGGFTTTNVKEYSTKLVSVTEVTSVPKEHQVLVFKQSEKAKLASMGYRVNTVHEFQGKQASVISLYRDSKVEADQIYKSPSHVLVALTRHTNSLTYYTKCSTDFISKIIDTMSKYSRSDLQGGYRDTDNFYTPNWEYEGPEYREVIDKVFDSDLPRLKLKYNRFIQLVGDPRKIPNSPEKPNIEVIQSWYDQMLPGNSSYQVDKDPEIVQNENLEMTITNKLAINTTKIVAKRNKYDTLRPVLRTSVGNERPRTQRETLLAYAKRNDNVPMINDSIPVKESVGMMVELFEKYVDPMKLHLYREFINNPITLTSEGIQEWKEKQTRAIDQNDDAFITERELNKYDFMIKTRPKVDLTNTAPNTYAALQTIAYQSNNVNQQLCPYFRDLKDRLLSVMNPRFKIFTDMSPLEFTQSMNKTFPFGLEKYRKYELDIAKYDKSQGELALEFDCAIMRKFGIPELIVHLWRQGHEQSELWDRNAGVKCTTTYQRKSGDPFTFLGNTLLLMAAIAMSVDLNEVAAAVFAGDDSVLWVDGELNITTLDVFQGVFNFEAKLYERRYPYFCSKFLLYEDNQWYFLPDLLKIVSKLGRRDLRNEEHVEDYRVSLFDLMTPYRRKNMQLILDEAMQERYPSRISNHIYIVRHILGLVRSREKFQQLYYSEPNDIVCKDPKRPSLEW